MPSQAGGGAWPDVSADRLSIGRAFTFSNAANLGAIGAVPLFTLHAGQGGLKGIMVEQITAQTTTTCTSDGSGTLALGITGSTSLFIAATAVSQHDSTTPVWTATSAAAVGKAIPAAMTNIQITDNIIATVGTANYLTGVIYFQVLYHAVVPGCFLTLS